MELVDFERDLRPFADPATDVEITGGQEAFRARLTRDGADLTVTIERETGKIAAKISPDGEFTSCWPQCPARLVRRSGMPFCSRSPRPKLASAR